MSWQARYSSFRDQFAEAMDPRFHTIDEMDAKVATGAALLWFGDDSAIAAEIVQYPGGPVIHGLVAAGNLEEITEVLIPQAEAWGKDQGCIGSLIESRPGWERQLKSHGYSAHQIALWKGF